VALNVVEPKGASIRLACAAVGFSETWYRYRPKLSEDNAEIADWFIRLTRNQENWGVWFVLSISRQCKKP
jgi:putative transposase